MAQLKLFTLCRGPINQTKMSLVTAGTDCMVSQYLWDVAVNHSVARDRQLQKLCHQRCCGSG